MRSRSRCSPRRPCGFWLRCWLWSLSCDSGSKSAPLQVLALIGPTVVLAGWWFVRNAAEFGRPAPAVASDHQSAAGVRFARAGARVPRGLGGEPDWDVRQRRAFRRHIDPRLRPLPSLAAGAALALITLAALRRRGSLVARVGREEATRRAAPARGHRRRNTAVGAQLRDLRSAAAGPLPARRGGRGRADRCLDDRVAADRGPLDGARVVDRGRWSPSQSSSTFQG